MAVNPKTGKPVLDTTMDLPTDPAWAAVAGEFLRETERLMQDVVRRVASEEADVPLPPDVEPCGVSPLRGAYGPWLAAQEMLRERRL